MDGMGSTMNMTGAMMVPYLHFTGGDYLIFKSLSPTSAGALAGASIFLFLLALVDRALAAYKCYLEHRWNFTRSQMFLQKEDYSSNSLLKSSRDANNNAKPTYNTFPPFIPSHDIPRGVFRAIQSFVGYGLMLAVMTFQAAYIIAIIIGLGVGETLFGRFAAGKQGGH